MAFASKPFASIPFAGPGNSVSIWLPTPNSEWPGRGSWQRRPGQAGRITVVSALAPLRPAPRAVLRVLAPSNRGATASSYRRTNVAAPLIPSPRPVARLLAGSTHTKGGGRLLRTNVAAPLRAVPRPIAVTTATWSG
jgi:hypothetical protein